MFLIVQYFEMQVDCSVFRNASCLIFIEHTDGVSNNNKEKNKNKKIDVRSIILDDSLCQLLEPIVFRNV